MITPSFSAQQLYEIALSHNFPRASTFFTESEYVLPLLPDIQSAGRSIYQARFSNLPLAPNRADCTLISKVISADLQYAHATHFPDQLALALGFWIGIDDSGQHSAIFTFSPPLPNSHTPTITFLEPQSQFAICPPPQSIYFALF